MRGILITGTDTGVGKTIVGCGLAAALTAQGKTVGVLKPAETGCVLRDGVLYPEDAARLAAYARVSLPLDQLCPYRFAPPVAPSVAAELAGMTIEPRRIIAVFEQIARQHDFIIVEGAGGLLVPLVGRYTFADLTHDLRLPLLVVVGSKLGALNHALLTLSCAQVRSLPVTGYILNHPTASSDLATQTNARTLAYLADAPCLGVLPFLSLSGDVERDRTLLCDFFSAAVDLTGVLR
ncbi:MAG: dethiobiotin synthase [Deltaproteobacteria bacterium]|nr:dethiobiotin synthase [Deltaproteobacteria bacterium]